MSNTTHGSLPTVAVLKSIAVYLHKAQGLPVEVCLWMAWDILGLPGDDEDAPKFLQAAKLQIDAAGGAA